MASKATILIFFQACNVGEAKTLYDQLTPMCPIMQAMTASAPIYRGYLADIDCRWDVLAESVDDRTKEERGQLHYYPYQHFILHILQKGMGDLKQIRYK